LRDQHAELRFRQAADSEIHLPVATPNITKSPKKIRRFSRGICKKISAWNGCVAVLGARGTGGADHPFGLMGGVGVGCP